MQCQHFKHTIRQQIIPLTCSLLMVRRDADKHIHPFISKRYKNILNLLANKNKKIILNKHNNTDKRIDWMFTKKLTTKEETDLHVFTPLCLQTKTSFMTLDADLDLRKGAKITTRLPPFLSIMLFFSYFVRKSCQNSRKYSVNRQLFGTILHLFAANAIRW